MLHCCRTNTALFLRSSGTLCHSNNFRSALSETLGHELESQIERRREAKRLNSQKILGCYRAWSKSWEHAVHFQLYCVIPIMRKNHLKQEFRLSVRGERERARGRCRVQRAGSCTARCCHSERLRARNRKPCCDSRTPPVCSLITSSSHVSSNISASCLCKSGQFNKTLVKNLQMRI